MKPTWLTRRNGKREKKIYIIRTRTKSTPALPKTPQRKTVIESFYPKLLINL
jgi:hypothetical protein